MTTEVAPAAPKKKRPWWMWVLFALGALVLCGIVGNMLPDSGGTDATKPGAVRTAAAAPPKATDAPKPTDAPKAHVDKAAFDKVETGMACADLSAIFGEDGEVMSETEVMGIKSTMLVWKAGVFGANVTIMCQDGKVTSKAQLGLK